MHTTNLRRVGGSIMLAVPPAVLEVLHLQAGAAVDLSVQDGRLVIEARQRTRYSLRDLLAQCDARAPLPVTDDAWTTAPPMGNELL